MRGYQYNTWKVLLSCPLLIILKSALFRGLRVYELKFRSKKDNGIIFFQWKLRCCFFQIWYPGGIQEASRSSILIWNFEIFQNFQKNTKFSNQNRASGGLLEASWVSDLEKGTSQLSLEKKIIPLSCLEKILGFVTYLPSKRV